jgi:hypothetical protein
MHSSSTSHTPPPHPTRRHPRSDPIRSPTRREEKELEQEAKRMAEERYRRGKEMKRKEVEEDRRRKKEAYAKWVKKGCHG